MERYFHVLSESGLWMVAPVDEQAYQLDGRYTKDPADVFSVVDEIQGWLRSQRYRRVWFRQEDYWEQPPTPQPGSISSPAIPIPTCVCGAAEIDPGH
jgi:hypothetical protein